MRGHATNWDSELEVFDPVMDYLQIWSNWLITMWENWWLGLVHHSL